jgi:hypothetical protein
MKGMSNMLHKRWLMRLGVVGITLAASLSIVRSSDAAVVRINQLRALHGGVTPGDGPGFPVTISRSGSYELTSNLKLPTTTGTVGIEITTENVEIDLNGFSIIGPRVCPDAEEMYCPPHDEDASYVLIAGGRNVTIKNGTLRGSLGAAIQTGAQARIEHVNVMWNAMIAIVACGKGSTLKDSLVAQNGQGVFMDADCLVTGNRIRRNIFAGLQMTGPNCAYSDNVLDCSGFSCVMGGVQTGVNLCNGSPCP